MSSLFDDDTDWQDMPVIEPSSSNSTALDAEDRKRYHWNSNSPAQLTASDDPASALGVAGAKRSGNATGRLIDFDAGGREWREKGKLDEMDYTRLELDDDPEEDEISMRTQYLFNEEKGMTPLSQMQATKTLLTEGQRIAYVGLCRLVAREMVQTLRIAAKGAKELEPATESAQNWANKIMGRLYRHMEVNAPEQKMIEQLAEHGVTAEDLVPSLVTTHTVDNPEYDPELAAEYLQEQADSKRIEEEEAETKRLEKESAAETERVRAGEESLRELELSEEVARMAKGTPNPFEEEEELSIQIPPPISKRSADAVPEEEGDIGGALDVYPLPATTETATPDSPTVVPPSPEAEVATLLPSSLPGVSTTLTAADKTITLDIRWTVLCDLFLSLIADSVYDARSRVLLGRIAEKLGLDWLDVVRFERRLTEALEIQEGVQKREHTEVLEEKRMQGKRQRYMMMGLATLGGGLVIGLSAGLLAPVIGAGLGAALTTVGVTGTTGFLAGAGGAAVVTSGGIIAGSAVGGKAMAKRTRHVKTFEFQPLHNNKRVNFFIAVPGFMSGPLDDVRLPFSTIDPVMGDVFAVLWEPDMMGDTGNALKILTSEVLTQVGQQVLAMTVMTALLSALQWPLMLTKLGYLIDNPWSNALDRARQAGAVLADILINRHLGVRPVSLVGFSLGARVIFYALIELAKAKAFGVVQEVYLFGATLTASKKVWRQVRGVVSGRFVNAYAMNDWVLGYLFRATSGGLNTVAGLRPIEHVPDLENVDITSILVGHMSYRTLMPTLLAHVGFKTTADHFDEPEEMDQDAPEREVLTNEQEAKREAEKLEKKERAKLGVFGKLRKSPGGSSASLGAGSGTASAAMSRRPSEDDDDLPPRMDSRLSTDTLPSSTPSLADLPHSTLSQATLASADETAPSSPTLPSDPTDDSFNIDQLRQAVSSLPPSDFEIPAASSSIIPTESSAWGGSGSTTNEWNSAEDSFPTPRSAFASLPSLSYSTSNGRSNAFNDSLPPPPAPSFAFGNDEGDISWSRSDVDKADGKLPPPLPVFTWGKGKESQNPW